MDDTFSVEHSPRTFSPVELPMRTGGRPAQLPPDGDTYVYADAQGRPRHRTVRLQGGRLVQEHWADGRWWKGMGGMEPLLYRLSGVLAADAATPIFLVAGEEDADALADLGLVATTCMGGATGWRVSYSMALAGRRVVVIPDNDAVGKQAARERCHALTVAQCDVTLLKLPDVPDHEGICNWLALGGTREELMEMVRRAPRWQDLPPVRLATVSLSEVKVQPVTWLWRPYLPTGKLTLMDGDPGVGKSFLALAIAAAVTRGTALPGANEPSRPGMVLLLCGEDALEDTVKPRLLSLGAEQEMVRVVTGIVREDEETPMMLSREGMALLDGEIEKIRPALVIIDPIVAYLHMGVDMHRANEVRAILRPLAAMAQRHGTAILALRHLTKAPSGQAIYRGQGSIDFAAAARSILLVAKDPDDPTRRIMAPTKASLSEPGRPLAFRIGTGAETPFRWEGAVTMEAQQLLGGWTGREEATQLGEAKAFLIELLSGGPMRAREIYEEARGSGIAEKTLDRAKAALGIRSHKLGRDAGVACWVWKLPEGGQGGHGGPVPVSGSEAGNPGRESREPDDSV